MKSKYSFFIAFIIGVFIASCSSSDKKKVDDISEKEPKGLSQFDWLIGNWENVTEEFEFYENWTDVGDEIFTGESFMLIDGDTVFSEFINLEAVENEIFYTVSVSDQNDGYGISFKLLSNENYKFVFNNPEHDYPQTIVYRYVAPDSLYAHIEGNLDGKYRREDFVMVRR